MLHLITQGIAKLFGKKSERDLKTLWPYVAQINDEFEQLATLSHDALRNKTKLLKQHIQDKLQPTNDEIVVLQQKAHDTEEIFQKEDLFHQIDQLKKTYNQRLEAVLTDILPQAFAIVKATASRFKAHKQLSVTAEDHDKRLAAQKNYIEIQGDQAIWHNQWEVAGHTVTWDMVHYDVQLIGGVILHQGKIAEMATGEGKTLVATLPAFLNALAGKGIHIITVNDYLAKRDAAWLAPIYEFHELTVDCIDHYPAHSLARKAAYNADITYGTNNEFGFDYLRDNMATHADEMVQRTHHFSMVDEVYSLLIDDARTPLIISGPAPKSDEQEYEAFKPRIQKLYEAQKQLAVQFLQAAKKQMGQEDKATKKEGALALFRAYRGLPKHKPLIKYLSEPGIRQMLQKTENYYLQDNARMMPEADAPLLFIIEEKNNSIELTEKGIEYITREKEDPHFFVMPDIGVEIAHIENNAQLSDQEKLEKKEALTTDYALKSQRIHAVNQLLKAYTLFEKDIEYILVNNRVKIVD